VLAPNQSGALNFAGSDVACQPNTLADGIRERLAKGRQPRRIFERF
jgi:hypothetical protein